MIPYRKASRGCWRLLTKRLPEASGGLWKPLEASWRHLEAAGGLWKPSGGIWELLEASGSLLKASGSCWWPLEAFWSKNCQKPPLSGFGQVSVRFLSGFFQFVPKPQHLVVFESWHFGILGWANIQKQNVPHITHGLILN